MPLDRRIKIVLADETELNVWAERADTGTTSTTDTERDVPAPTTGVWSGVTPDEAANIDIDQWTVRKLNGELAFGPWKSPTLTSGQPIVWSTFYTGTTELILVRSRLGFQAKREQFVPDGWPIAITHANADPTFWYSRRPVGTSTDSQFRLQLYSAPVGGALWRLTSTAAAAITNFIMTPYAPAADVAASVELRTAYFETRVYRTRFDARLVRGVKIVDGADTWTVDQVAEVNRRGGFMDLSARRRVAKLPA